MVIVRYFNIMCSLTVLEGTLVLAQQSSPDSLISNFKFTFTRCGHEMWSRDVVTRCGHEMWSRDVVTRCGHEMLSRDVLENVISDNNSASK